MNMFLRTAAQAAGIALALTIAVPATAQDTPAPVETAEQDALTEQQQFEAWAWNFLESLTMKTGHVVVGDNLADIEMGETFYFLDSADSKRVLEDAWGNPPSDTTLGMLFPAEYTPLMAGSWGVTVEYEELGYVSDEDAGDIDYNDLLETMKEDTRSASAQREEMGYEPIELIGWASPPYYDAAAKKLHWAKELKFGDAEVNTLNYNVRILGRRGVLVLNFIATIDQLPEIQAAIPTVLQMTNFSQGNTYAEFDPSVDEMAAVGIGGLIAGKVLSKAGLFAAALVFLKKFWFIIVAAIVGLWKMVTGRKDKDEKEA